MLELIHQVIYNLVSTNLNLRLLKRWRKRLKTFPKALKYTTNKVFTLEFIIEEINYQFDKMKIDLYKKGIFSATEININDIDSLELAEKYLDCIKKDFIYNIEHNAGERKLVHWSSVVTIYASICQDSTYIKLYEIPLKEIKEKKETNSKICNIFILGELITNLYKKRKHMIKVV